MNSTDKSLKEKSIVFIGFMGAGKTTIGKLVANKLSREFIDIDKEIETEYNMTTSAFFKTYGEKAFRQKKKVLFLSSLINQTRLSPSGAELFYKKKFNRIAYPIVWSSFSM